MLEGGEAQRRDPPLLSDCYFYQTIDLPGHGVQLGAWDLRTGVNEYLGHTDFTGKRVLELGTANGFLCFEMERRGAQVTAADLSERDDWDIVPYRSLDVEAVKEERRAHVRKINNAWWLAHQQFRSRAQVVYSPVYALPAQMGPFDISIVGSILLHLRDPFRALERAAMLTTERMVVTDLVPGFITLPSNRLRRWYLKSRLIQLSRQPTMTFLPDAATTSPVDTWWALSPAVVARFLGVLGFRKTAITFHEQRWRPKGDLLLFTVVGTRE